MKPIIFNTDMVKAILEGRKTQMRMVMKGAPVSDFGTYSFVSMEIDPDVVTTKVGLDYETLTGTYALFEHREYEEFSRLIKSPYQVGDILYVRETWQPLMDSEGKTWGTHYATGQVQWNPDMYSGVDLVEPTKWRPSIHMPKEAARLFLRVTDVRVERLQEITEEGATKEGFTGLRCPHSNSVMGACFDCMNTGWLESPIFEFYDCWESIYAKRGKGWDVNPWVWVIEFEVCEKLEDESCDR